MIKSITTQACHDRLGALRYRRNTGIHLTIGSLITWQNIMKGVCSWHLAGVSLFFWAGDDERNTDVKRDRVSQDYRFE